MINIVEQELTREGYTTMTIAQTNYDVAAFNILQALKHYNSNPNKVYFLDKELPELPEQPMAKQAYNETELELLMARRKDFKNQYIDLLQNGLHGLRDLQRKAEQELRLLGDE